MGKQTTAVGKSFWGFKGLMAKRKKTKGCLPPFVKRLFYLTKAWKSLVEANMSTLHLEVFHSAEGEGRPECLCLRRICVLCFDMRAEEAFAHHPR